MRPSLHLFDLQIQAHIDVNADSWRAIGDPELYPVDHAGYRKTGKLLVLGKRVRRDADGLVYAQMDGLVNAAQVGNPKIGSFCKACMDGAYPTGDVTDEMLNDIESERLRAHETLEG